MEVVSDFGREIGIRCLRSDTDMDIIEDRCYELFHLVSSSRLRYDLGMPTSETEFEVTIDLKTFIYFISET